MADERIIYNGVSMAAHWPAEIETAQHVMHYIIGGKPYARVRCGAESEGWGANDHPYGDCGVLKGQYHVGPVCDVERRPRCGGQVISCDCDYAGDNDES